MKQWQILRQLSINADSVKSTFDYCRKNKQKLVKKTSKKNAKAMKSLLHVELPNLERMLRYLRYMAKHRRFFKHCFSDYPNFPIGLIMKSLEDIIPIIEEIKEVVEEELELVNRAISKKDLYYYNSAFKYASPEELTPYQEEEQLYAKLESIIRGRPVLAPLSQQNRSIWRSKKGALAAAIVIVVVSIAAARLHGSAQINAAKQKAMSPTSQPTQPSTQPTQPATRPAQNPFAVLGRPTISTKQIESILESNNSPAKGQGKSLYDLGIKYGIDPVVALAFFKVESNFGKLGVARKTKALGNIRPGSGWKGPVYKSKKTGRFRKYNTWAQGFEDWYRLIRYGPYIAKGRTTLEQIIPVYAPSTENNTVRYIILVKRYILKFRKNVPVKLDGTNHVKAKASDSVWKFWQQYKKMGGKLGWGAYYKTFLKLNKTDKLSQGKVYQLPPLSQ